MIFHTAIVLIVSVSCAFAYVPPAEEVFSLMPHQKHRLIRALALTLETTFHGEAWPEGEISFTENVCFRYPDRFYSVIEVPSGRKIYAVQAEKTLTAVDNKIISMAESHTDRYKDLFLYRSPESLVDALLRAGIDTAIVSFGRLEGRIAYVIGAVYPDESFPQVWVDKDTFRPLRILFPASEGSEKTDIRYEQYFNIGHRMWYPGLIIFYSNDKIIKEQRLRTHESSSRDDAFPEYLFDIDKMQKTYRFFVEPDEKDDASSRSELDQVKKSIDDFQKAFE